MPSTSPLLIGAVVYDPKVVIIWDIIKDFFIAQGCPMDYVFYSNYTLQVDALLSRHVHIAWNSPLAHVDAELRTQGTCRAIAMRDTDRDRVSHLLVRKSDGIGSIDDLRGRTVVTGASDSPQSTLIPLNLIERHGLLPGRDFTHRRFDLLVGKHGDHIGGEQEALRSLQSGQADACAVLDFNWDRWSRDGTADPNAIQILATTESFDHCVFTVHEDFPLDEEERWKRVLFSMTYDNPDHREMMDLEGLKEWKPGRTTGFTALREAVTRQGFFGKAAASL